MIVLGVAVGVATDGRAPVVGVVGVIQVMTTAVFLVI